MSTTPSDVPDAEVLALLETIDALRDAGIDDGEWTVEKSGSILFKVSDAMGEMVGTAMEAVEASYIVTLHNSHDAIATALRAALACADAALARADAAEARVVELEGDRPRLVEKSGEMTKDSAFDAVHSAEWATDAIRDYCKVSTLAEVEAALALEAPKA